MLSEREGLFGKGNRGSAVEVEAAEQTGSVYKVMAVLITAEIKTASWSAGQEHTHRVCCSVRLYQQGPPARQETRFHPQEVEHLRQAEDHAGQVKGLRVST